MERSHCREKIVVISEKAKRPLRNQGSELMVYQNEDPREISDRHESLFSGLSVVINTCNRALYLRDCLQSLAHQSVNIEVVVVNGPSTDDTEMVCHEYTEIVYRRCDERNLSKSRNIGIAAASGEVVAFIDDDAVAHEDWAKNLLSAYADDQVGGAGGFTLDNTGRSFQSRHLVSDWRADSWSFANEAAAGLLTQATGHYASVLGANSSFRRSDLVRMGGFDEVYAYFLDETDVCARLAQVGKIIKTVPSALVLHRYAPSHVRNEQRLSTSLCATIRSKVYFCYKFASQNDRKLVDEYVGNYLKEQEFSLRWHIHRAQYTVADFFRLQAEIRQGADEGRALATSDAVYRDCLTPWAKEENGRDREPRECLRQTARRQTRIAFISQGYPPSDTNGIARWTKTIAEAISKLGHIVHVITKSVSGQSATEYNNGVWVHYHTSMMGQIGVIPPVTLPASLLQHASCVRSEVLRVQSLWGLDVVSGPIWDVEAILCHGIPGLKTVTSLHTTYALMRPFKADWRFNPEYDQKHVQPVIEAERWLIENSPLIVANSQSVLDEIKNGYAGIKLAHHTIVPHGFDLSGSAPQISSADAMRLVFIGREEKRKGIDLLLRAVLDIDMPFDLQIVGSTPGEDSEYPRMIEELTAKIKCKSNIRLQKLGFVDDPALDRIYREASMVIVPSRYESFGLVVIEAMGRGVPVIVADVGGMSEIVTDGEDGLKFAAGDHVSLKEALMKLLTDPELLRRLAANARRTFENRYTADRMALSFLAALNSMEGTVDAKN